MSCAAVRRAEMIAAGKTKAITLNLKRTALKKLKTTVHKRLALRPRKH